MGTSQSKTQKLKHYLETQLLTSIYPPPPCPNSGESSPIKTKSKRPQNVQRAISDKTESLFKPAESEDLIGRPRSETNEKVLSAVDGRTRVFETHEWPYSVHGVVSARLKGHVSRGTGTLIGPNIVLTAAHILYSHKQRVHVDSGSIQFLPAVNGQNFPFKTVEVETYFVSPDYIERKKEDYAILVLKRPIGEETGYFGLACLDPSELVKKQVNITGYPEEKETARPKTFQMWGMGGQVSDVSEEKGEIHYLIDTGPGQSGSGIWYQEGEDYYVCGIHIRGNLALNSGTLLTRKSYQQIFNPLVTERIRQEVEFCERINLAESSLIQKLSKFYFRLSARRTILM